MAVCGITRVRIGAEAEQQRARSVNRLVDGDRLSFVVQELVLLPRGARHVGDAHPVRGPLHQVRTVERARVRVVEIRVCAPDVPVAGLRDRDVQKLL